MAHIQLARNLYTLRKSVNLTQEALSEQLNLSRQAYSNYERGNRTPDLDTLITICQYFCITMDELISQNLRDTGNLIQEREVPYYYSMNVDTADTIYLTKEEVDLVLKFRDASDVDQQLIHKVLSF